LKFAVNLGAAQVYKQKVKHLLYEQQNNIAILKVDGEMALKLQGEEGTRQAADLQKDKRLLRVELKEQVPAHHIH
jgi:growth arrest-specific protein 8